MSETPSLPPLLTGAPTAGDRSAFDEAVDGAKAGRLAAGDLIWRIDRRTAEAAIVLEPDVSLPKAAAALLVAALAAGDALAALLPPKRPTGFIWPDRVLVDGGEIGRVRLCSGPLDAQAVPQEMVVGLMVRLALDSEEPGRAPDLTSLEEEGAGDVGGVRVIESFARHFVYHMHVWETEGMRPIVETWTRQAVESARFVGFDPDEGVMFLQANGVQTLRLADAVERIDA